MLVGVKGLLCVASTHARSKLLRVNLRYQTYANHLFFQKIWIEGLNLLSPEAYKKPIK